MDKNNNGKKVWYKRFWVWIIIIIVVIIGANLSGGVGNDTGKDVSNQSVADTSSQENKKLDLKIKKVEYKTPGQYDAFDGDQVAIVTFTVKNNEYDEGVDVNPIYFKGETKTESDIDYSPFGSYDMKTSKLKKGVQKEYTLTFAVEKGDKLTKISYDPLLGDKFEAEVK